MTSIRAHIINEIEQFCEETGMSVDKFCRRSVGDNFAVKKLKAGVGVTLTRIEAFEKFMEAERQRRRDADQDAEAA